MANVTKALLIAQKMLDFLKGIRSATKGDALTALKHDIEYIKNCISSLESRQRDKIEEVWQGVQNIDKFFGGDYLSSPLEEEKLDGLMDEFFHELLDAVAEVRKS